MSYREGHYFSLENNSNNINNSSTKNDYHSFDFSEIPSKKITELWNETLQNGMHGICYSMYEDGQKPEDTFTAEQVNRRIQILKPYSKWVRSFSCIEGNEFIPKIAHENGMQTLVGAWLSDDLEKNEKEIEALIQLAKEGCVNIVAVGNEVMYRGDLTEEQLVDYINRVKLALPNIPVGYVDAYYEFSHRPRITEVCDLILTNCYPYWEGCPIENALNHMVSMFNSAKDAGQRKRVIITETGWPSQGGSLKGAVATDENVKKYFIETVSWCKENDVEIFYFLHSMSLGKYVLKVK